MKDVIVTDAYVEQQLGRWGKYIQEWGTNGLGFPYRTILGALKEEGGILSRSYGPKTLPVDEDADRIEHWVSLLHSSRIPREKNAARALIFTYADDDNLTPKQISDKEGVSVRLLQRRLELGRFYIKARLVQYHETVNGALLQKKRIGTNVAFKINSQIITLNPHIIYGVEKIDAEKKLACGSQI